jgi:hypothetical protein
MPQVVKEFLVSENSAVRGIDLGFRVISEHWNEYELEDGTLLRIKTILLKAIRVVDENDKPIKTPLGDPEIVVNTTMTVVSKDMRDT